MEHKFIQIANDLYDELVKIPSLRGEVVIDDRTKFTVGRRIYEAERIGYPYIIVIGKSVGLYIIDYLKVFHGKRSSYKLIT